MTSPSSRTVGPRKAKKDGIDDALRALKRRKGAPAESDRPPLSTLPGRKIKPLPGQLDLAGGEEPHRD